MQPKCKLDNNSALDNANNSALYEARFMTTLEPFIKGRKTKELLPCGSLDDFCYTTSNNKVHLDPTGTT